MSRGPIRFTDIEVKEEGEEEGLSSIPKKTLYHRPRSLPYMDIFSYFVIIIYVIKFMYT